jgi:hypothetical protein
MPRPAILLAAALLLGSPSLLPAQTDYYARLGVTGASTLLEDAIVGEVRVEQSLAPTLALGAGLRLAPNLGAGLELGLASGSFHREETLGDFDLGTLRTLSALLNLNGRLIGPLDWRGGVGMLTFLPSDKTGIFRRGGGSRFLVGGGVDYRRPAFSHWDLMASARYDYHRFSTDELVARGFTQGQGVQRISLSVGLARGSR